MNLEALVAEVDRDRYQAFRLGPGYPSAGTISLERLSRAIEEQSRGVNLHLDNITEALLGIARDEEIEPAFSTLLPDGRELSTGLQLPSGASTLEEITDRKNPGDRLMINISSPGPTVIGFTTSQEIASGSLTLFRVWASPHLALDLINKNHGLDDFMMHEAMRGYREVLRIAQRAVLPPHP